MLQVVRSGSCRLGRDPLLWIALSAVLGILLIDYAPVSRWPLAAALVLALAATFKWPRAIPLLISAGLTFAWLHSAHLARIGDFPGIDKLSQGEKIPALAVGTVLRAPTEPEDSDTRISGSLTLRLDSLEMGGARLRVGHNIRVRLDPLPPPGDTGPIRYGDRIRLSGTLERLASARNPGAFDPRRFFYRSIGALVELRCGPGDRFEHLQSNLGNPLRHFAEDTREHLANAICYDLDDSPQTTAILKAMALGAREQTPDDLEDLFRLSGSLHIFAVSGMHVGIFAAIVWALLSLLRLPRRFVVLLVIPIVLFYAVVTGLRPSACRAAIMASTILLGLLAERQPRLLNSLGFAALVLLAIDTQQIFLPGFQLSFAVLVAIAVLANPVRLALLHMFAIDPLIPRELVPRWRRRLGSIWAAIAGLLAMSLAAWIGSAPLVIWHFHLLTPVAIVSNLVMVPLAAVILSVACLSLLLSACQLAPAALLANNANWLLIKCLTLAATAFAAIPGGHLSFAPADHYKKAETPPLSTLLVLDTADSGAAQIVSAGAHNWLIDTGSAAAFAHCVEPALRAHAVNDLDGLVLTHGDLRHIGGTPLALERFTPKHWLQSALPNRSPVRQSIEASSTRLESPAEIVAAPQLLPLDKTTRLRVLFPPPDYPVQSAADDQAVVLRLESGPWSVLLMSDAGFATERWLLDHCPAAELRSAVIVKGQHRGDASASADFLHVVDPLAIVATNASFPAGEAITESWRRDIERRAIALFDQSQTGAVEIRLSERELRIDATVNAQTFRSRSR